MPIQFGIIGCGSIARHRHLPELSTNKNVKIKAVCDIVASRAEEMAEKYSAKAYFNYQDLLSDPQIDAVIVCNKNIDHATTTIDALKAGKHVLCEKPMSVSLEEADEMIRTAKQTNKFLMIGYNQRLFPAHIRAKELLKSKRPGKVLTFRSAFGHRGCEYWAIDGKDTWFFERRFVAFGTSADLAIHKIDLIRWLLDDEVSEVKTMAETLYKKNGKGEPIDVEDTMISLLRMTEGAIGTITASWIYAREDNSTTLYCENGIIRLLSDPQYDLIFEMNDGTTEYHNIGGAQTNEKQTDSGVSALFVQSILNQEPPEFSGEEGKASLKVVLDALESAGYFK